MSQAARDFKSLLLFVEVRQLALGVYLRHYERCGVFTPLRFGPSSVHDET